MVQVVESVSSILWKSPKLDLCLCSTLLKMVLENVSKRKFWCWRHFFVVVEVHIFDQVSKNYSAEEHSLSGVPAASLNVAIVGSALGNGHKWN